MTESLLEQLRREHGLSQSGCDDPWPGDALYPAFEVARQDAQARLRIRRAAERPDA